MSCCIICFSLIYHFWDILYSLLFSHIQVPIFPNYATLNKDNEPETRVCDCILNTMFHCLCPNYFKYSVLYWNRWILCRLQECNKIHLAYVSILFLHHFLGFRCLQLAWAYIIKMPTIAYFYTSTLGNIVQDVHARLLYKLLPHY